MIANQPEVRKVFGLDLLRVLAIVLVLASHSLWIYSGYHSMLTRSIDFLGSMGVELFFVLSGFLVGGSMLRLFVRETYNIHSVYFFLSRRALRIMPVYFLILLINIAVAYIIGYSATGAWRYFFFLQNFASPMLPFFPESWSMPIKELPYFAIPIMLLLVSLLFKHLKRNYIFLIFTLFLIAIPLVLKIKFHFSNPEISLADWNISLRSVVIYRVDSVMIGVLFAWIRHNYQQKWIDLRFKAAMCGAVLWMLICIAVGSAKVNLENTPFLWNVLLLPVISIATSLFLPMLSDWQSGPKFLELPVRFLGDLSYLIYLIHYSLVLFLMKYFLEVDGLGLWQLNLFAIGYLAITISISWFLHQTFEKPMLRLRKTRTL
ncbi:MAG TPA: acyltransferase [Flavobacterium sp.]